MPTEWRSIARPGGKALLVRLAPVERQTVLSDTVTVTHRQHGDLNISKAAWIAAAPKGQ